MCGKFLFHFEMLIFEKIKINSSLLVFGESEIAYYKLNVKYAVVIFRRYPGCSCLLCLAVGKSGLL